MTEPIRRPEVDVLADYVEGLLDADARVQVERHIAEDPRTAELVAELEALPGMLAAVPVEPMPAEVVARVDAALARESQDRAASPVAHQVRAVSRSRRWLAPALAVAGTVAVVAIAAPVLLDQGGPDAGVESAGDAPAAQEEGSDDAAPESLTDEAEQDPPPGAPGGGSGAGDPAALTSTGFASQVEALYADAEPATEEDLAAASGGPGDVEQPFTLPAERLTERVAPVCVGDVESTFRTAIILDGEPAYLLVYGSRVGGGPQQAVAFFCDGDEATILDQQPVDLP